MFLNYCYKSLCLSFLLFSLFKSNQTDATQTLFLKSTNIQNVSKDLPLGNTDLIRYLRALGAVTHFAEKYRDKLDFQFYFGLFLVNVQLTSIKNMDIAKALDPVRPHYTTKILNIVLTIDRLLRDYKTALNNYKLIGPQYGQRPPRLTMEEDCMMRLMDDPSAWVERLDSLSLDLLSRDNPDLHKNLLFEYAEWSDYIEAVSDFDNYSPSPVDFGSCLASLHDENAEAIQRTTKNTSSNAIEEQTIIPEIKECLIPPSCHDMVLTGNTFGYFLTHRFMFMLLAHLGKGCYIFSKERDKNTRKMLCAIMYVEASYIAANEFVLGDLMLEQMTFCALDGHAQFLRRSWIDSILKFQTKMGCFYIDNHSINRNKVGGCDLHTTALAATTLAAVVRFVVEETIEATSLDQMNT